MAEIRDKVIEVNVDQITPYNGSHKTDAIIGMIKESIEMFGIQQPIGIDKNYVTVYHTAVFKAAVELGYKTVPCVVLDTLTDEQISQYRIADDKTSEFAKWNQKKLQKEMSYFQDPASLQFCFDQDINQMLGLNPVIIRPQLQQPTRQMPTPQPSQQKPTLSVAERDKQFKESLKEVERSMNVPAPTYFEYTCSKCGKKVAVKM